MKQPQPHDKVIRKYARTIEEGCVVRSWFDAEGEPYIRVYWLSSKRESTLKSSRVSPYGFCRGGVK